MNLGAYTQVGRILVSKGDRAFARGEYHSAKQEYLKAITLYTETGFLQSGPGAFAQLSMGTAAAYLYDYSEANHWLDAAWRTLEKTNFLAYGRLHCDIIYGTARLLSHPKPYSFQQGILHCTRRDSEKRRRSINGHCSPPSRWGL